MNSTRCVVELEKGVWLAPWKGDPGRTLVQSSARKFNSKHSARRALMLARRYRPFADAAVLRFKANDPKQ